MRKPRLLLVDDEKQMRELLEKILLEHYEVHPVETANMAFEYILSATSIDILVTDFNLKTTTDGLDVALAIREKFPAVPILLVTASLSSEPRVKELLSLSNTVLVEKPFSREKLLNSISVLLA